MKNWRQFVKSIYLFCLIITLLRNVMFTVPKGALATCGVIIGLDQSGIKFFHFYMRLPTYRHTNWPARLWFLSVFSSFWLLVEESALPAWQLSNLRPVMLVPHHLPDVITYNCSTQRLVSPFVFQLPLQAFTVPISILPSSLFLICKCWLENLANLDSTNGSCAVAVLLLAHTRYIGLSSLLWV